MKLNISALRSFAAALALAGGAGRAQQAPAPSVLPSTLPNGGKVVAGQASIDVPMAGNGLTIQQDSARAAIDWSSFNIGSQARVNIVQPSSGAVLLNRVLSPDPSQIFGSLTANGQVFLSNPAGLYFAPGASADVGGLVATTHAIGNTDFMAGNYTFDRHGASGSVVNDGALTARLGGYIALLAPEVRNGGVVTARMGTAALAAGERYTLHFDGTGNALASIDVAPATIRTLVDNHHAVLAPDGQIILSARAAAELRGAVVNNSGTLDASSMVAKGGRILITGDDIMLAEGSQLKAGGEAGGGTVLVGGDWQGRGGTHPATSVTMAPGASIDASAGNRGDGGQVVLWSDVGKAAGSTSVQGRISARGGALGGNGGQVETSGHLLNTDLAQVDAGAARGLGGEWLLDPYAVTIAASNAAGTGYGSPYTPTGNSTILASSIQDSLNLGTSVLITTGASGSNGGAPGTITWSSGAAISKTSGGDATLTLKTGGGDGQGITLNGASLGSTSGALNLVLWTRSDNEGYSGTVSIANSMLSTNGGNLWIGGGLQGGMPWNGLAVGDTGTASWARNGVGLHVSGSTISTGAGHIFMSGQSFANVNTAGGTQNYGLWIDTGTSISTSSGSMSLSGSVLGMFDSGIGALIGGSPAAPVAGNVSLTSGSGAIGITGSGSSTAGSGYRHGLLLSATSAGDQTLIRSGSGAVTLTGSAAFSAYSDTSGLQLQVGSSTGAVNVVSSSGSITLSGQNSQESGAYQNAIRFTTADAANSIRIGYDGTNLDSGNILIQGNSILQRTEQPGSGSIAIQTTGRLTIAPMGAAFTHLRVSDASGADDPLVFSNDWNFGTALGSFTLGKASNTLGLTLGNPLSVAGSISLYGGDIAINAALTSSATGNVYIQSNSADSLSIRTTAPINKTGGDRSTLTLRADGWVGVSGGISASGSTALDTVIWSDYRNTGSGGVSLSGTVATNGGNLWVGGSNSVGGSSIWNGLTVGDGPSVGANNFNYNALDFKASINTAGGDVMIWTGAGYGDGISGIGLPGNASIRSGSGNITLIADAISSYHSPATLTLTSNGKLTLGPDAGGYGAAINFGGTTSSDGSFTFTGSGWSSALVINKVTTLGGLTLGRYTGTGLAGDTVYAGLGNSSDITVSSPLSIAGPINVFGGNIALTGSLASTASGAAILAKATGNIAQAAGVSVTSNGGAVTYWADSDGNGSGNISMLAGSGIASSGGNVTLGGGLDIDTGYASYKAAGSGGTDESQTAAGVALTNASINAGSGGVVVRGQSLGSAQNYVHGISIRGSGGTASVAGGAITMEGIANNIANATDGSSNRGISVTAASGGAASVTGSGAVAITGTGAPGTGGTGSNNRGIFVSGGTVASTGSSVALTGTGRSTGAGNDGIGLLAGADVHGATTVTLAGAGSSTATAANAGVSIDGTGTKVYSSGSGAAGLTTITGTRGGSNGASVGIALSNGATLGGTGESGDVTLQADEFTITGAPLINSSGKVVVESTAAAFSTALNWAMAVTGPASSLRIGKTGNTAAITVADAQAVAGPIALYGGDLSLNAALVATNGGVVTLSSSGAISEGASGSVTADKLALMLGGGNATLNNTANSVGTLASSGVNNLAFVNAGALTIGGVNVTTGIQATGAVDVRTLGGDLTVAANIATALGLQPAITLNAGAGAAAGTASGGNILISGSPVVSTGANGQARLYSGNVAGSAGLTALVGSGSGRFRYDSDESFTGYTSALGSGLHAIYREQPAITITADDKRITYADTLPTWTYTSNALNGDLPTLVLTSPLYSTAGNLKAGDYAITPSLSGLGYAVTANSGKLGVGQKPLMLNGFDAAPTKVYNGDKAAAIDSAGMLAGVAGHDDVSVSNSGASYGDKNVGTGKTVTLNGVAISGSDAANYSIASTAIDTADITARPLTLSGFSARDKVYDRSTGATIVSAGTLAGVITDDVVSAVNQGATFDTKDVGLNKRVTLNDVSLSGADAGNYSIATTATSSASVSARPLTLTGFSAQDKVYDRSTSAGIGNAGTLDGVIVGDAVIAVNTGASFDSKDAGRAKTVSLNGLALSGADAGNYSIDPAATTTASITPKALTLLGFTAQDKVYDRSTSATISNGGTLDGVIVGDAVSAVNTGASFDTKDASRAKTVSLNGLALGGADAGNYSIDRAATTTASITPKTLTLLGFTAQDKVYDRNTGASIGNAGTLDGVIVGDAVSAVNTGASFDTKDAGRGKTVSLNGLALSGADAGNYSIDPAATTTASITPKALTLLGFTAQDKVYDRSTSATISNGGTLDGVIVGDAVIAVNAGASFDTKDAGRGKTVSLNGLALSGADAGNYSIDPAATTTASITPKALTLLGFSARDKVYDRSTSATISNGGTLDGVIVGDAVSATNTGASFDSKDAGRAKTVSLNGLALSGADAGNYSIDPAATTTASITPKALTLLGFSAQDKVYDRSTSATIGNGGTLDGVIVGDAVSAVNTGASFDTKDAGRAKTVSLNGLALGGVDAGNYSIDPAATTTASITPKALTLLGFAAQDKVYDRSTDATIAQAGTLDGVIAGDLVGAVNAGASFDTRDAGAGKHVTLNGVALSGADAGNYSIADSAAATAAITARPLALVGFTAQGKVYDGNTTAAIDQAGTLNGLLAGDAVTVDHGAASFADRNVGQGKPVTLVGVVLAGADAGNYSVAATASSAADITPRPLHLLGLDARSRVYDGSTRAELVGTVSLGGLVAGDAVAPSLGAASFDNKDAGKGKTVTVDGIGLRGADAANYSIAAAATTTADIQPRALTLSFGGIDKVYDASTAAAVSVQDDRIAGDELGITRTAVFQDANAGRGKPVQVSGIRLSGADAGNYSVPSDAGTTADITPRPLALAGSTGLGKVYDGTNNLPAGSIGHGALAGVLGQDAVGIDGAALFDSAAAGQRTVLQGTLALGGAQAGNYSLQWTHGSGTIQKAQLTVRANDDARFTTESDVAGYAGASFIGLVHGETPATAGLTGTLEIHRSNAGVGAAGSYTGVLNASGLDAANYALSYQPGDYAIVGERQLLVRVADVSSVYGTPVNYGISSARYLSASSGQIVDVTGNVGATGNAIVISGIEGGTARFELVAGGTATSSSGQVQAGAYQVSAQLVQVAGDALKDVVTVTGTHSVSQKPLTASASGASKVYDGTTAVTDVNIGLTGLLSGDAVTVAGSGAFASKNAGSGVGYMIGSLELSGSDARNYYLAGGTSISGGDGLITPRPLTLSFNGVNKVYDGNSGATVIVRDDRIAGDSLNILRDAAFADKNVGTGKAVSIGGIALAGADAGNYSLATRSGSTTASITRLDSVTWIGGSSGNWFDPANWQGGAVPDLSNVSHVLIPNGVSVDFDPAHLVGPAEAGPVHVDGIGSDGGLRIRDGELDVGPGGIELGGLAQDGGSLHSSGSVEVKRFAQGGGDAAIDGSLVVHEDFKQQGTGTLAIGGDALIADTQGGVVIGTLSVNGRLDVDSSGGSISQADGTAIHVQGPSGFKASADGLPADIDLGRGGNDFAGPVGLDGGAVTVRDDSGGLVLGDVKASGPLGVESSGGGIAQAAGTTVRAQGPSAFKAVAGGLPADVDLGASGNDFVGAVSVDGAQVTVRDGQGGVILGTVKAAGPLAVDSSGGGISQAEGGTIAAQGASSFKAGTAGAPGDVDLGRPGNAFGGAVSLSGATVSVRDDDAGGLLLGDVDTGGDLRAGASQGVQQAGGTQLKIGGDAVLDAGGKPVLISQNGNSIGGKLTIDGLAPADPGQLVPPPPPPVSPPALPDPQSGPAPVTPPAAPAPPSPPAPPAPPAATTPVLPIPPVDTGPAGGGSQAAGDKGQAAGDAMAGGRVSQRGVEVQLVRDAGPVQSGIVNVMLPTDSSTAGSGFSFALPPQVFAGAPDAAEVEISLQDGRPLPGWLRYEPATRSFLAGAVPDGAFPLQILVRVKDRETVVVVSERPAESH